jgi:dihydrofolate reductase
MRTISTSLFQSLDGVLEAENDWQFRYLDEETFAALTIDWARSDAALLGRRSFEGFVDVRANYPDSPVVGFLGSVDRYVVSGPDYQPAWEGTAVIGGDVPAQVRRLKEQDGGNILVIGSPTLIRTLLAAGLIDDLVVVVLPIVVGSGPRLTPGDGPARLDRVPLRLAAARTLGSGAVHLTYAPGEPA